MKLIKVLGAVALFLLLAARSTFAISPAIIMIYGGALKQPVFLINSMVFHDIAEPTDLRADAFADRDYLKVAMFWGTKWNQYVSGERPLKTLTPEMASQHGRFYPATTDKPGVLLQTRPQQEQLAIPTDLSAFSWGGELAPSWIDFLVARGIPAGPRGRR